MTISTKIPSKISDYTQYFNNSLSLNNEELNYISDITVHYILTGFYNIGQPSQLRINLRGVRNSLVRNVLFQPGLYTAEEILKTIADQFPSLSKSPVEYSRFTSLFSLNKPEGFESAAFNFTRGQELSDLMGFTPFQTTVASVATPVWIFTVSDKSPPVNVTGNFYSMNPITASFVFNKSRKKNDKLPENFQSMLIGCDLISTSSTISNNYLVCCTNNVDKQDPPGLFRFILKNNVNIPLVKTNLSSIKWKLRTINDGLFSVPNGIDISITILSQKLNVPRSISNIGIAECRSISVEIPPNTSDFTQYFRNTLSLSPEKLHFISRVSCSIDSKGVYNVKSRQFVRIRTTNPEYASIPEINGIGFDVYIDPGYYTREELESILNLGVKSDHPLCSIPFSGPNAFKFIINNYERVGNVNNPSTIFGFATPELRDLLGITLGNVVLYATDRRAPDIQTSTYIVVGSGPFIGKGYTNDNLVYRLVTVGTDLISTSSLISGNYLTSLALTGSDISLVNQSVNIPLVKTNFSSITWRLYNGIGQEISITTPTHIFIQISSINK
jgi:hypothetical protein